MVKTIRKRIIISTLLFAIIIPLQAQEKEPKAKKESTEEKTPNFPENGISFYFAKTEEKFRTTDIAGRLQPWSETTHTAPQSGLSLLYM